MKLLRALCVLAIALCLAGSVYAETQSVKVSGDLTMRGIARYGYDLRGATPENDIVRTGNVAGADTNATLIDGMANPGSEQTFFMTVAEVEVDADLTDNVQTVIRLVNQRDWNVYTKGITNTTALFNGRGGYTENDNEFDVNVDLAYVTLKNFIYSPLTLTIGRQDLWFGKGFIVGLNQQNPGATLHAPEYTAINSFDAVKAVLDYDPWTITGIYSKIFENAIGEDDDVDLWGLNVGYKFDSYKAEAEAYYFLKKDNQVAQWGRLSSGSNDVNTMGIRGSFDPIDVVTIALEGAWQLGNYSGSQMQLNNRSRSAGAIDASIEWRWLAEKFSWKPKLGAEYIWYSGNNPEGDPNTVEDDWNGWDPMYRGKFDSAIREFIGKFYSTYEYAPRANYLYSCADASYTNQHQVIFMGSIQPVESLIIKANYNLFWNQERYSFDAVKTNINADKTGGFIGQEVDLQATWDYTEDVSFNVLGAFFVPGEVYRNADKTATDLVGSVKVNF